MKQVQQNLKTTQDRQKNYVELKITPRDFQVGDHVYIKINPHKSTLRLGKYNKFPPRYGKAFEIIAKVGSVAYQLTLPPNIKVHNVFYVPFLKRYIHDLSHVIDLNVIQVEPEGEFQVGIECLLDRRESLLQNHTIGQIKVQSNHHSWKKLLGRWKVICRGNIWDYSKRLIWMNKKKKL